jgi:ketosteroid isomerase-like protein
MDDDAEVLRLDESWNEAYRRHDRAPLADILSDDFAALTASGAPITKAALMANPSGRARCVIFSDQGVRVFGETAVSHRRLRLELEDRVLDQWFLRVFSKRDGRWQAVSVAVTPFVPPP